MYYKNSNYVDVHKQAQKEMTDHESIFQIVHDHDRNDRHEYVEDPQ